MNTVGSDDERVLNDYDNESLGDRCGKLLRAFAAADDDQEMAVFLGVHCNDFDRREDSEPAIVIEISEELFGFTTAEAMDVATAIEAMCAVHRQVCQSENCFARYFPELVNALCWGIEKSEAAFRRSRLS